MRSWHLALASLSLFGAAAATAFAQLAARTPAVLVPTINGQAEYCITCHSDLPEISAAHPVETFGCVVCHGGERLATDANLAHSTMRGGPNPSDYAVVEQSCGGSECHGGPEVDARDHIHRALTSLQSTYAGAIANIMYTFGAQPDFTARFGMVSVTDEVVSSQSGVESLSVFGAEASGNPFIVKFAENCTTCHVNAVPQEGDEYRRFTGCAACHSPMERGSPDNPDTSTHTLTTAISYVQCNTCHNRGNYDLGTMEFVPRSDHAIGRPEQYYQPIAQFTKCEYTLDCVDCHPRSEVMGDGEIHSSKAEIQYVQCRTCHGTAETLPRTATVTAPNSVELRLAQLNPFVELQTGERILVTEHDEPLWNTRVLPDGTYEIVRKATGEKLGFRPVQGSGCLQNPEQQASQYCHECHAIAR